MPKLILFLFFQCLVTHLIGQQGYWQQSTNYSIDVTLNPTEKTLEAVETIQYTNNSPDTLRYIWFHLYPNAYKNDRTAFSNDMLRGGDTRFYFADKEARGYINRLDFKVNGASAATENHPEHIDIIKLLLPQPLPPGAQAIITTPFHVQLPANFSRSGWDKTSFQVAQWYPKPAVYDKDGWHPMPYLDQGEFYSEFGSFEVRITLPVSYLVAATGRLAAGAGTDQVVETIPGSKSTGPKTARGTGRKTVAPTNKAGVETTDLSRTKTLVYRLDAAHDFAFFAGTGYVVNSDTCLLSSGKVITVSSFFKKKDAAVWKGRLSGIKDAVRFFSHHVGEYPYPVLSVVAGQATEAGGMEYPTMAIINPTLTGKSLDLTIAHEIGHNWFYGMLGNNERAHPWMDEGLTTFYERKYERAKWGSNGGSDELIFQSLAATRQDQPIETPADVLSPVNYTVVPYHKAARWLELLETTMGAEVFRSAMKQYFGSWKFKHPQPADFKENFATGRATVDSLFGLLHRKGTLPYSQRKDFTILTPFNQKGVRQYIQQPSKAVLAVSPLPGYNQYDKLLLGLLITNYTLPPARLQYLALPMYATGSQSLNGVGKVAYTARRNGRINAVKLGISGMRFSKNRSLDSNGMARFESFRKVVPYVRATWKEVPGSTRERWLEAKTFFITEKEFSKFVTKFTDQRIYVDSVFSNRSYINTITYAIADHRALYPWNIQLGAQSGKDFYRLNVTGNYYFNYSNGGGTSLRVFGAKFGYVGSGSGSDFKTARYQPKLLAPTGEEDYTYGDYFLGRTASYANDRTVNQNGGLAAQQVMIRDGGMKLRIDQYAFLQGRSEDWVAAINLTTTLPPGLFPFPLPLRLYLDIGTYSEAWKANAPTGRLLYTGGIQLSVLKNSVHVYLPIVHSNEFRTYLKTLPEQNGLGKRLTFSIDVHRLSARKLFGNMLPN